MTALPPAGEHGSAARIEILPVTGLPEFRPGDDLAAALSGAAPWLRDGDVVVVTSKVVSKCEGRLVPRPRTTRNETGCAASWSTTRRSGCWPARNEP